MPPEMKVRNLKRGETLLKANDKLQSVFLFQKGCISLLQEKSEKLLEKQAPIWWPFPRC